MIKTVNVNGYSYRFDNVDNKDIVTLEDDLRSPYLEYSKKDIKTRLEHVLNAGTCPFVNPLVPLAYQSGAMTLEEVNLERIEEMKDRSSEETRGYRQKVVYWSRCGSNLTADPQTRSELYAKLHSKTGRLLFLEEGLDLNELSNLRLEVKYGKKKSTQKDRLIVDALDKSGMGELAFYFGMSPLKENSSVKGIAEFPKLIRIGMDDHSFFINDFSFVNRFKFALPYVDKQFDTFFPDVAKRVKALIDEQGYLFVRRGK